jgi:hypothetical protein
MENVKRQDEREDELRADADELEEQGDELEESREKLGQQVEAVREEFDRKKQASDVPGAQAESHEGSDADPRPGTSENAGAADDEGQATGNPPNDDSPAADEDEDEDDG